MKIEKCLINYLDLESKKYIGNYGSSFKNSFIIKVKDENNKLISVAVCSILTNSELEKELEKLAINFKLYSEECNNNEYEDWKAEFINKLENSIYLEYITSIERNIGGAKFIIDYIKKNYNKFWLYSAFEAEEYWSDKIKLYSSEEYFYSTEMINL